MVEDNSIDTTATGPIAISLELPIIAYINGGTTLVSTPINSQKNKKLEKEIKEKEKKLDHSQTD